MSTSSARGAKTLYPAALIFSRRSSSVVMRSGSTEWMRKGSMIVLKRSGTAAPMLVRHSCSDETDRLGEATGPGLAVSRQYERRIEALELRERLASAREVRPERRELRSGLSGQHVQGREGVPHKERTLRWNVKRRAALAVTWNVDHARRPRHVKSRAVAERGDLGDRCRPKHPLREREGDETERRETDPEHLLVLRLGFAPRHLRIDLVHAHGNPSLAAGALRETDVIDMGMRQHERANVGHRSAHRGGLSPQIGPAAGRAGVDDRDLATLLEEVRVDEAGAEPGDPRRDLQCTFRFGSAVAATAS